MQKEILYKYDKNISNYQQQDQAIYNVEMQNPDMKQISKLTKDTVSFSIPQLNINYCNSFNENFDITIEYQPIEVYDLNLFITGLEFDLRGKEDWKNICITNNGDENYPGIYTYTPWKDPTQHQEGVEAHPLISQPVGDFRFDTSYTGSTLYPKPHTFSLQQQSINSLLNELNYPLKHIPYGQDPSNPVYHYIKQDDGTTYRTRVIGEVDISNQIFWDTYNGKLRFNYNGIQINTSTWTPIGYGYWKDQDDSNKGGWGGGYETVDSTNYSNPYSIMANLGYWPLFQDDLDGKILTYNNGGTFTYNYQPAQFDVYDLMNNIKKSSEQTIYVKQLDSLQENCIFAINNFYYANQLMGFMQTPQQIFEFLYNYVSGLTPDRYNQDFYPQTQYNNYHVKLTTSDDDNKYLKNVCALFYLSSVNASDGFDQYINRQVCLSKEFFLQIWREVYVLSPQLQSNTILFKPENIVYKKQLKYTNTNNANGKEYINQSKVDSPYLFNDKLNCICYYVNSVSFNNYVSLQNNYPLQYDYDQKFEVEALRSLTFILTDENGIVLPRLSEFKVYLQFAENQNNAAQSKTTNFNRVLTGDN